MSLVFSFLGFFALAATVTYPMVVFAAVFVGIGAYMYFPAGMA